MSEDRHALLARAAAPRRAVAGDAADLSHLFAAAFLKDPVFDWISRPGPRRSQALEQFFFWLLQVRAIPFGEVWTSDVAAAAWLPPGVPASPGGLLEQIKLLPLFLRLCGFPRLPRGAAMADAMEKNHPHEPHYYLAFVAVAPRLQGLGLGGALLEATLKRIDEARMPAYLENSNPKNARLYERCGFSGRNSIAPAGAPPLTAMWRQAHGSSSESQ